MGYEICFGKCGSMLWGCNVDFNDMVVERIRIRMVVVNREESVKDDEEDGDVMFVLCLEFFYDKYLNKFIYIVKYCCFLFLWNIVLFIFIISFIFFESNSN